MATGEKRPLHYFGPWGGLNEHPGECGPGEFEDLWNIYVKGDLLIGRGGRQLVAQLDTFYPARCMFYLTTGDGSVTGVDFTAVVTDANTATYQDVGAMQSGGAIWLGFTQPVGSVTFTIGTGNANASTLSAKYTSSVGLLAVSGLSDGTASAGKTLAVSGALTFAVPADWRPTSPGIGNSNYPPLYWLKLEVNNTLSGTCQLEEITSSLVAGLNGFNPSTNGAFHWRRQNGDRFFVVGLDDTASGIAKLFAFDRLSGILKPFIIPGNIADGNSGPDAKWVFTVVPARDGDILVAANGYCFLYSDPKQPFVMSPFTPALVSNSSSRTVGAPSKVKYLTVYADQLAVVESDKPNTLQLSDPIGGVFDLIQSHPLGGMSIWDTTNQIDCIDERGGPITGIIRAGTRLYIYTPTSSHYWDGFAHREFDTDVGCIAPKSLKSVETVVYFLASEGPYCTKEGRNQRLYWRIKPTCDKMNKIAAVNAVAEIYHKRNEYRLWVPMNEDGHADVGLVYNYINDTWTKFGVPLSARGIVGQMRYVVTAFISARDEEWGELLYSLDQSGQLWLEDNGVADYMGGNPIPIPFRLVSDRISFENQDIETARYVYLIASTQGEGIISVGLLRNGSPPGDLDSNAGEVVTTQAMLDFGYRAAYADAPDPTIQVFASGASTGIKNGVDTWVPRKLQTYRFSLSLTARAFQLVFSCMSQPTPLVIRGWDIDLSDGKDRRGSGA